jgi:hypothetical protein
MKEYKLTDGSVTNVQKVSERVGCPTSTANSRLLRHSDPEKVYQKYNNRKIKESKKYKLLDGTVTTALEVVERVGCHISLARMRLSKHQEVEKVFAPMTYKKSLENSNLISESYKMKKIKSRGVYDPMFVLALKYI